MKQEYIVIPKQNEWLHDLIGKSYNQKLINKALGDLYDKHRVICRPGLGKSIVTVSDTKTKEILGIGGSSILENIKTGKKIADITTRNLPRLITAFCRDPVNAARSANLILLSGGNTSGNIYRASGAFGAMFFAPFTVLDPTGTYFQVGSGTTAPAITDFAIETAFGTGPEDAPFDTGTALYNDTLNQITISDSIIAGGAGTINESAWHWAAEGPNGGNINLRTFNWFHDSISPGVPFIATNTITVSYQLQF